MSKERQAVTCNGRPAFFASKKLIRRILCKANYDKCNGCEDYSCWKMKKQRGGRQ